VVFLFEGEVLPLALDGVPVGRTTRGHRFLAPGEICVSNAAEYLERLGNAHVMLNHERRKETIRKDLETAAAHEGYALKPDAGLLDEVTGLVEFPVVLAGAIDTEYMTLPPEVLATAMRTHQRYFSCLQPDGTPAPRFLFVANNIAADHGKSVIAGNERVLRARLADARFFWDQDSKIRLENRVEALKGRVFHEKLGSVYDKIERMEKLAEFLVGYVPGAGEAPARRAARLAKADLATGMVGEFPELQGTMGRYYATGDGEDRRVANGIAEHYRPLGPNDTCPTTPESIVVALSDKIDSLFAFFWVNEKPSGSRDPFGLRRAAQGVIRIILENGLRLPLLEAFRKVHEIFVTHQNERVLATGAARYSGVGPFVSDISEELLSFFGDRLIIHLRERGFRHDYVAAAFSQIEADNGDLVRLLQRVEAVRDFLDTDDGANLLIAYRRASNIVAIEERRYERRYHREIDTKMLREPEEFALARDLELANEGAERSLARGEFDAAMGHLAALRRPIDDFFDKVTVNCDDAGLRENRLRLLSRIRDTMNQIADFSRIEG
jgi:glycyl-tRNA synthetase beta chain